MENLDGHGKEPTDGLPHSALTPQILEEIEELAERRRKATGVLMQASNFVSSQVDDGLNRLPESMRARLEDAAQSALHESYRVAVKSRTGVGGKLGSDGLHRALGTLTGAVGGFGGLPTALIEVPVITTVFFRAVQTVAAEYGEDPISEDTRKECLRVFGSGEDMAAMPLSGATVSALISKVAPRFAGILSQKLATQTIPVIGAAAGATTNYAFVDYYVSLAHVHFGLRKLGRLYGTDAVMDAFTSAPDAWSDQT